MIWRWKFLIAPSRGCLTPNRAISLSGAEKSPTLTGKRALNAKSSSTSRSADGLQIAWGKINHTRAGGDYPWDQNRWSLSLLENSVGEGRWIRHGRSCKTQFIHLVQLCLWMLPTRLQGFPPLQSMASPQLACWCLSPGWWGLCNIQH